MTPNSVIGKAQSEKVSNLVPVDWLMPTSPVLLQELIEAQGRYFQQWVSLGRNYITDTA